MTSYDQKSSWQSFVLQGHWGSLMAWYGDIILLEKWHRYCEWHHKINSYLRQFWIKYYSEITNIPLIGQRPDMVYLPPRGNFVDDDFLEASCLASFLQHVSPLAMEALPSNSPLHMLPIQRHKFNIKRTEVRIHVNICRCSIKSYFI